MQHKDGAIGYIVAPSDSAAAWRLQWVSLNGKPHLFKEPQTWAEALLTHYLVPGDKVELLPIKDIWPEHALVEMEGLTVTLEAWRSGAMVVVAHDTLPAVSFAMTGEGNAGCWPLSRVKKL